jgi:hypothetical protein
MTENVEKFWEVMHKDHHQTVHELADTIGISLPGDLTENFNIRHIAMKFVPQLLISDQKQRLRRVSWTMREG